MTAVTDSMRAKQLHNQIMDLNYKIGEIVQTKSSLMNASDDLMPVGTDYDPESPMMRTLKARQDRAKIMEQQLDQKMHDYQMQLKAAETEYSSVSSRLSGALAKEMSYSSGGGG